MLREGHTCVSKFMKYCEKARLAREVCYNGKLVSKAHPLPATSPNAHTTTKTLQMSHSPTISSTIWEITTVPKVLKKKNPERLWPLLFDHDACCFHVQVDSSRFLSPSTDSEVVTALGWGCVHVTELRRGQVVCLVDGGTLQLLSQVPGLEDKKKHIIRSVGEVLGFGSWVGSTCLVWAKPTVILGAQTQKHFFCLFV